MTALEHVLSPIPIRTFFNEFWEKKPLHVKRNQPCHFDGVISTPQVEWVLRNSSPRYPALRLVNPKIPNMPSLLQEAGWGAAGKVPPDLSFIYKKYQEGATITVQDMQTRSEPIARLCTELSGELQQTTNANIYLTPPHAQGFGAHFDKHDVIIIQIEGCKLWKLNTPDYLLPTEEYHLSGARPDLDGMEPDQQILLNAGDTLYLPRGWIHAAATNESPSLHVTLGVHVVRWRDLLVDVLLHAAEHNLELREALMLEGSDMDELTNQAIARWKQVMSEDPIKAGVAESLERQQRRRLQKSRALPGTQLASINRLATVDAHTKFQRRPYIEISLQREDASITLIFSGAR